VSEVELAKESVAEDVRVPCFTNDFQGAINIRGWNE